MTEVAFYSTLEMGMTLIAVNLPSLSALSLPNKAAEWLGSMKGLVDQYVLRSSSSKIADSGVDSGVAGVRTNDTDNLRAYSFKSRASESSHGVNHEYPLTSLSFLEDPEKQTRTVTKVSVRR
jgi:hypothetical protein